MQKRPTKCPSSCIGGIVETGKRVKYEGRYFAEAVVCEACIERRKKMKPDWKAAPEWASYLAMDSDGVWCWFEKEPAPEGRYQTWEAVGESREESVCLATSDYWEETLEKRPE